MLAVPNESPGRQVRPLTPPSLCTEASTASSASSFGIAAPPSIFPHWFPHWDGKRLWQAFRRDTEGHSADSWGNHKPSSFYPTCRLPSPLRYLPNPQIQRLPQRQPKLAPKSLRAPFSLLPADRWSSGCLYSSSPSSL